MAVIIFVLASFLPALAVQSTVNQTPVQSKKPEASARSSITATYAFGEVIEIKAAEKQIVIKTKEGNVTASFDDQTQFKGVAPGVESLEQAQPISLAQISAGDVLMARGQVSDDKRTVLAKQIIVMNKTAIAEKQVRDREQWRSNSLAGRVVAVNQQSREVTVSLRTATGEQSITVNVPEDAAIRRYAANSVKFADALPSSLQEIKAGDQLRILGEKSQDGTHFTAKQVISGSFRILGGPVLQVDRSKSEIVVNDVATQKPVTVVVNANSTLRNVPAELVASLVQKRAQSNSASATGARSQPATDLLEIFDSLPPVTFDELKNGRMLLISATTTSEPSRVNAVLLATGLDPLFSRPQAPGQRKLVGAVGLPNGVFDGFIGNP